MQNRPIEYLSWTTGQPDKVLAAPANLRANGWGVGVSPPSQYLNWQIWLLDQWVQYLDRITNTGTSSQAIRLINGGEWQFVASTGSLSWSANANLSIPGISDSNNIIPAGNVSLSDGDIAYVTVNPPLAILGDIAIGSDIISNVNFTANLTAGMEITQDGIPSGTTIIAIGDSTLTISSNATATSLQAQFIASSFGNLTMTVIAEENFIPNLTTILVAKRLGKEIYLGINSTQMVLRDHEFKPFMGSGYFDTYEAIVGENLLKGEVVYISSGVSDGGRTSGRVYKLDTSAEYKDLRGTYAGTVISDTLSGSQATLVYNGFFRYSGLVAGSLYWSDPAIPGAITNIKPDLAGQKRTPIGFANTSESLIISGTGAQANDFSQPIIKEELLGIGDGSNKIFNLSTYSLNTESLFLFSNGGVNYLSEYSLAGKVITFTDAPGLGQSVYAKYILAGQEYLQGFQETPSHVSGNIYSISGQPTNKDALFVFIDRNLLEKSQFSLTLSSSLTTITLNDSLEPGQDIYCFYLSPVGFSNTSSPSITSLANIGTGVGVFDSIASGVAKLKSVKNGPGITVTDMGEEIVISAPGVAGGFNIYGSRSAPVVISGPSIVPNDVQRQIIFIKSSGGDLNVSIDPGTIENQELVLVGTHLTNRVIIDDIEENPSSNAFQNGQVVIDIRQAISYFWSQGLWEEQNRKR